MTLLAFALAVAAGTMAPPEYDPSQHDNLIDFVRPNGSSYIAEVGACHPGDFDGRPGETREGKIH